MKLAQYAAQDALTADETSTLDQSEQTIRRGLATFVEVGQALAAIRDQRLYRQTHATFEAYCSEQWQLRRARAYEMIEAADVTSELSSIDDAAFGEDLEATLTEATT